MTLTLGFSPCPNDCFMFDAMVHRRIDLEGLDFDVRMADIEALNSAAFAGDDRHHETELPRLRVLRGRLRAARCWQCARAELRTTADFASGRSRRKRSRAATLRIAIPGKYTDRELSPVARVSSREPTSRECLFSDIEGGVLDGRFDAGLIIHENRFTYADEGTEEDHRPWRVLGVRDGCRDPARWHRRQPRAAGRRSAAHESGHAPQRRYAFANRAASLPFVRANAQEMSEDVMYRHIDLYVNDYSVDLGVDGRRAVEVLFERARASGVIPEVSEELFLSA